jgi:uncharacterized protein YbjT (DUF2867 family)
MNALFNGGTGLISSACVERAVADGWDPAILNRGLSKKYSGLRRCTIDEEANAKWDKILKNYVRAYPERR